MLSHYSSAGFLMEQDQTDQVCEVQVKSPGTDVTPAEIGYRIPLTCVQEKGIDLFGHDYKEGITNNFSGSDEITGGSSHCSIRINMNNGNS